MLLSLSVVIGLNALWVELLNAFFFVAILLNRRDSSLQKLWYQGIYNGTGLIDEEYQCYDESTCQPSIKQLEKITLGDHDIPIKEVFKTFKEINQLELVNQAGIRQQYIDQSVSLNLAFPAQADPKWINKVHLEAWKKGIKTLYYMRTESVLRGDIAEQAMSEDCLSCDG